MSENPSSSEWAPEKPCTTCTKPMEQQGLLGWQCQNSSCIQWLKTVDTLKPLASASPAGGPPPVEKPPPPKLDYGYIPRHRKRASPPGPDPPPKCKKDGCTQTKWWTLISETTDEKGAVTKTFGWACSNDGKGDDGKVKRPPCSMFKPWVKKESAQQDP